jgi:ribonuclease HI
MQRLLSLTLYSYSCGCSVTQQSVFSGAADDHPVEWKLYIDGASRKNPGPAGVGVYLLHGDIVKEQQGCFVGIKTNNQAEYLALLLGLYFLKKHAAYDDHVHIISDSQLLVRHIQGVYKIKNAGLAPLYTMAHELLEGFDWSIDHVLREHNTIADALANRGIDTKKPLPSAFVELLSLQDK